MLPGLFVDLGGGAGLLVPAPLAALGGLSLALFEVPGRLGERGDAAPGDGDKLYLGMGDTSVSGIEAETGVRLDIGGEAEAEVGVRLRNPATE